LVPRFDGLERLKGASLLGENDLCALGPHEGLGVGVVAVEIVMDGILELGNARERAAPDPLLRDLCEEALNQIEPRRSSRMPSTVSTDLVLAKIQRWERGHSARGAGR
jgi:hypothetical protein